MERTVFRVSLTLVLVIVLASVALAATEMGIITGGEKGTYEERLSALPEGVLVEYPYVDKDYRSTYYGFYAKKGQRYDPYCVRLHFFNEHVQLTDDLILEPASGKLNENYFVFGVTKRTDADLAEFIKQRDSLMQTALDDRKRQVFDDYLAAAQQRMQNEGRIKIYEDVLDRLTEEEPAAAPPSRGRPRLPITK